MIHGQAGLAGRQRLGAVLFGATCLLMSLDAPGAEDLKGRWSLAGSVSYWSTRDYIRSNATLILGPAGDDGIPFTFDPNEDLTCSYTVDPNADPNASNTHAYCDPRPDDELARPIRIGDAPQYNVNASYGVTSWLSLRLDAAYSRSHVGPIDFFVFDHFPRHGDWSNPTTMTVFEDRQFTQAIRAGEMTEVPVTLSAVLRFRPKRAINPYIIIGGGKVFTDIQSSDELGAMNTRLGHMRIRGATNEYLHNVVPVRVIDSASDARIPYLWDVKPRVENAFTWHLGAGIEYFFNSRVSLVFEGRCNYVNTGLNLDAGTEDQVNLITWSEEIYRADGSVRIFAAPDPNSPALAPNPLCSNNGFQGLGCSRDSSDMFQRVNPEGRDVFGRKPYTCPAIGDFDRDGQLDICYSANILPSPKGYKESRGDVIVQGGTIDLSSVSAGVSVRFHF